MRRLMLMMLLVATVSAATAAQETTGTITGVTIDQTGGVLQGVTVTVRNTDTGFTRTVVTNETGSYTAALLPIGAYEVVFELRGFQGSAARGITLHVNDRLQIDGRLGVGGVAESVEVSVARQLVQPIAALQSTMGSQQVKELPLNNRNFVQLATLAPGVSSDLSDEVGVGLTSTVSISINGARRNAVNWLVDGVSDVDVGSNITLLSTPSLESIEEFKIITNGYQAEWPRSGGGIVNVVTKSGSSRFAGSAYETANLSWFNPNAYAPAADGTFGNSKRAEFRQPGRNQTDLSLSKNWAFNGTQRIQFRADMINAFNHTQWQADPSANGLDNTCTISLTTCNPSNDTFGQILNTRAPREIQLGLKLYW